MPRYGLARWQRYRDTSAPSLAQRTALPPTGWIPLTGRATGLMMKGSGRWTGSQELPAARAGSRPCAPAQRLCTAPLRPAGSLCSRPLFMPCPCSLGYKALPPQAHLLVVCYSVKKLFIHGQTVFDKLISLRAEWLKSATLAWEVKIFLRIHSQSASYLNWHTLISSAASQTTSLPKRLVVPWYWNLD